MVKSVLEGCLCRQIRSETVAVTETEAEVEVEAVAVTEADFKMENPPPDQVVPALLPWVPLRSDVSHARQHILP